MRQALGTGARRLTPTLNPTLRPSWLGVGGVFAFGVVEGLKLESGVLDADVEVRGDALLEVAEHAGGVAVVEAAVVEDDVGGEHGQAGGDGGGVQVVDALDVGDGEQVLPDVLEVQPGGC